MARLESLLAGSALRFDRTTKPIQFDLAEDGVWNLDARRATSLVAAGAHPMAALRVTCSTSALNRLLNAGEAAEADFRISGDAAALDPLIAALTTTSSAFALRLGAMS